MVCAVLLTIEMEYRDSVLGDRDGYFCLLLDNKINAYDMLVGWIVLVPCRLHHCRHC